MAETLREITLDEARRIVAAAASVAGRRTLTDREHTAYLNACRIVDEAREAGRVRGCAERLYNGTTCGRPATTTVPLDFTDERRPVCARHAR